MEKEQDKNQQDRTIPVNDNELLYTKFGEVLHGFNEMKKIVQAKENERIWPQVRKNWVIIITIVTVVGGWYTMRSDVRALSQADTRILSEINSNKNAIQTQNTTQVENIKQLAEIQTKIGFILEELKELRK